MTGAKSKKKGRPSLYTDKLAAKLCRRLAEGETLRSVCRDKEMPDKATVLRWLGDKTKIDFRGQYAHARDMQADALFDEALEIADDVSGDWTVDKDGKKTTLARLFREKGISPTPEARARFDALPEQFLDFVVAPASFPAQLEAEAA